LNVVYDKTPNRLSFYDSGEWETHPFDNGVKQLLDKVKFVFFDKYEEFLLEKNGQCEQSPRERITAKELLEEYYKFLVSFDLRPFVYDEPRLEHFKEFATKLYDKMKKGKSTMAKDNKKNICQIIKNNCAASIHELNKRMMDIICSDEEFKKTILQKLATQ
jgi:hypothetical protein